MLHLLSAVICSPAEAPGGCGRLDGERREIISAIRFNTLCVCVRERERGREWKMRVTLKLSLVISEYAARTENNNNNKKTINQILELILIIHSCGKCVDFNNLCRF